MAKSVYKIPVSIDRGFLDHEIPLSTKSFQVQPMPMKVIFFWLISLIGLVWLVMSSPLKSAGIWLVPLVIWWLIASAILGKNSKTKEMAFQSVIPVARYSLKSQRTLTTRSASDPSDFFSVAPFREVSPAGLMTFGDGSVAQAYLVVGSASRLVFDDDRTAILNRVDQFWRKAPSSVEYIWLTTKEPQRVHRQVAALGRMAAADTSGSPEIRMLMEERLWALTDFVGARFTSIHQYLVIKADNLEELQRANTMLLSEIDNSSLMIRQCTRLNYNETRDLMRTIMGAGSAQQ